MDVALARRPLGIAEVDGREIGERGQVRAPHRYDDRYKLSLRLPLLVNPSVGRGHEERGRLNDRPSQASTSKAGLY